MTQLIVGSWLLGAGARQSRGSVTEVLAESLDKLEERGLTESVTPSSS